MATVLPLARPRSEVRAFSDRVRLRTESPIQFIDVTDLVAERVRRTRVIEGLVCVQVQHTTAAVLVNEDEPLLIEDMTKALERVAPSGASYAHDDLGRRGPETPPCERRNGHAHCKAMALPVSATLNIAGGRLQLGRWQRILLVELDGPQPRTLSLSILGGCA